MAKPSNTFSLPGSPKVMHFPFLSDPTPIIGHPFHYLTALTPCRLVDLIDVTLACADANSKHVDVVTVADVDDEDHVSNSLLQI